MGSHLHHNLSVQLHYRHAVAGDLQGDQPGGPYVTQVIHHCHGPIHGVLLLRHVRPQHRLHLLPDYPVVAEAEAK